MRAASRSRFFSAVTFGNARSSPSRARTTTSATANRANHLWSAGITYQGAWGVLVAPIISS